LLKKLRAQAGKPHRWDVPNQRMHHIAGIRLKPGFGVAVLGPVAGSPSEHKVREVIARLAGLRDAGQPEMVDDIIELLSADADQPGTTRLPQLLDSLLKERASRTKNIAVTLSRIPEVEAPIEAVGRARSGAKRAGIASRQPRPAHRRGFIARLIHRARNPQRPATFIGASSPRSRPPPRATGRSRTQARTWRNLLSDLSKELNCHPPARFNKESSLTGSVENS
jgi:hypothetical protein